MAISKRIRQVQYMLLGWVRHVRRRYLALSALVFGSLLFASMLSHDSNSAIKNRLMGHRPSDIKPSFLHVLVPANAPDVNLCKTIISAVLAGYPTPTIINWGRVFQDEHLTQGGSHIAKISGVLQFLKTLDSSHDEDLVVVVDGYDIWFQLGPQVLIDRYHELVRDANARIAKRIGKRAMKELNIHQAIFFGAQKECWPGGDNDMNCYAAPHSTLPEDIYGPDTDHTIDDERNPSLRFRQRYMNSGTVMGSLAEMRRFYERSMVKFNENANFGSDQSIFAGIFGEQEYQREVIRLRYLTKWQKWKMWYDERLYGTKEHTILDPHPSRFKMEAAEGAPFDFGVGLDYASSLGQATVFAEYDSDWVLFKDTTTIVEAYDNMNITSPGAHEINKDILDSPPPFWTTSRLNMPLPSEKTWKDVMVYTNLYTGISPAIIHHNAHRDNLKSLRETVWNKMWFQPHIRDLVTARLHEPYLPVAVTGPYRAEKSWWGPTEKRSSGLGAQPDYNVKDWLKWDDIADDDWSQEVFRDDKGKWKET